MKHARAMGTLVMCLAIVGILAYSYLIPSNLGIPSLVPSGVQRQLTPIGDFDLLPQVVSSFLWGNRSFDLIGQSFVILASVVCCLALLKMEGEAE